LYSNIKPRSTKQKGDVLIWSLLRRQIVLFKTRGRWYWLMCLRYLVVIFTFGDVNCKLHILYRYVKSKLMSYTRKQDDENSSYKSLYMWYRHINIIIINNYVIVVTQWTFFKTEGMKKKNTKAIITFRLSIAVMLTPAKL